MGIYPITIIFYGFRARITPKLLRLFDNNPDIEILKVDKSSALVMIRKTYQKLCADIKELDVGGYIYKKDLPVESAYFDLEDDLLNLFTGIKTQWVVAEIMYCSLDGFEAPPTLTKIYPIS